MRSITNDYTCDQYYYQNANLIKSIVGKSLEIQTIETSNKSPIVFKEKITCYYDNNKKFNIEQLPIKTQTLKYVWRCQNELDAIISSLFDDESSSLPDPRLFSGIVIYPSFER